MIVKKLNLLSSNVYLVLGEKEALLIDAGDPCREKSVLKFLRKNLKNRKLLYLFITHIHWDHIGASSCIKERTFAKIVCSEKEGNWAQTSFIHIPPPQGSLYSRLHYNFLKLFSKKSSFKNFSPDILISKNSTIQTEEFKIYLFLTPGHTPGSTTIVVFPYAFTGDTLLGPYPFHKKPRISHFIHNKKELLCSIEKLKTLDIERYYPGHGRTFDKRALISLALSSME